MSWCCNRYDPGLVPKLDERLLHERLGEYVCRLIHGWDEERNDSLVCYFLTNIEISNIHVLGSLAELVILDQYDSGLVIFVDGKRFLFDAETAG